MTLARDLCLRLGAKVGDVSAHRSHPLSGVRVVAPRAKITPFGALAVVPALAEMGIDVARAPLLADAAPSDHLAAAIQRP